MPSSLPQQFHTHLKQQGLLMPKQTLLVCVSGGCDSIALLHLLLHWQPYWKFSLHILHFHHGLRTESEQEWSFVKDLAEQHQLPFHGFHHGPWEDNESGIQEKSRLWRQSCAEAQAPLLNADAILTAHHADDQTETLLMKLLRGCHLSSLQGMSDQLGLWTRPLLPFPKKELQAYLTEQNIPWCEDQSNQEGKYLRNRVRHEVLPLLEELAGGNLHQRFQNMAFQSQNMAAWLSQEVDALNEQWDITSHTQDRHWLQEQPLLLQETLLHRWIQHHLNTHLSYEMLQELIQHVNTGDFCGKLPLPNKHTLAFAKSYILIT